MGGLGLKDALNSLVTGNEPLFGHSISICPTEVE